MKVYAIGFWKLKLILFFFLLSKDTTYKPDAEAPNAVRATRNNEMQQVKFWCYKRSCDIQIIILEGLVWVSSTYLSFIIEFVCLYMNVYGNGYLKIKANSLFPIKGHNR